jgi:hypothetical protein
MDKSQPPPRKLINLNLIGLASYAVLFFIAYFFESSVWPTSLIYLLLFALLVFSLYVCYKNAKYLWTRFYRQL